MKPGPRPRNQKRARDIRAARRKGLFLREIGRRFQISHERVRQIIMKGAG